MLPKKHRISRSVFAKLRYPVRLNGKYFSVSIFSITDKKISTAACVVSRKISNKATVRNRVRRRVYEALKDILPRTKTTVAIVVYPKRDAQSASYEEARTDINRLMRDVVA